MVSPVDTSVKWARSTMPGAPTLTRAAGSLVALLDALLVNGWGLQTASAVTIADGVATAVFPSDHAAAPHAVVLVEGATGAWSPLNGEQKVTTIEPNKVKWATALPDGTASGTITVKMAPAGWTIPFTGTNLRAYKSAHPYTHGQFLRVNDTSAAYARAVGYETMTAISTGTGLFPSAAQVSGGYYWGKDEDPSGSSNIPWTFFSDGRAFYFFPQTSAGYYGVPGVSFSAQFFGDAVPESPSGDAFATLICGSPSANFEAYGAGYIFNYASPDGQVAAPRQRSGAGTASRGGTYCELNFGNASGASGLALPNPITGAIPMGRVMYKDSAIEFYRAAFPGLLMCPINVDKVVRHGEILEMPDGRAVVSHCGSNITYATSSFTGLFVDITGPWR